MAYDHTTFSPWVSFRISSLDNHWHCNYPPTLTLFLGKYPYSLTATWIPTLPSTFFPAASITCSSWKSLTKFLVKTFSSFVENIWKSFSFFLPCLLYPNCQILSGNAALIGSLTLVVAPLYSNSLGVRQQAVNISYRNGTGYLHIICPITVHKAFVYRPLFVPAFLRYSTTWRSLKLRSSFLLAFLANIPDVSST